MNAPNSSINMINAPEHGSDEESAMNAPNSSINMINVPEHGSDEKSAMNHQTPQ